MIFTKKIILILLFCLDLNQLVISQDFYDVSTINTIDPGQVTPNTLIWFNTENSIAASFSPTRAEYEFNSISLTSDLVINEFMADNENTVTDQDGEYDDWIEFYNNGSETLNLFGYTLSDDASAPDQWMFPDTTIGPGAFLIVWADSDEEQDGLHANFKLSKSGESILLSDAGLNMLDEVNFGQQYSDTTTGRYPNGTGDFVIMPPTFAAENLFEITDIATNENTSTSIRVYPNPTKSYINIEVDTSAPQEFELISLMGKQVLKGVINSNNQKIDISFLSPNIYILKIGNNTHKIIKTK